MTLPVLEEINVSATALAPNINFLTTTAIDGTGVFDVLMKTVKLHLTEEYDAGRVSGVEYTQVYLGALTAVLQQSVTYLLNHQSEEKINAEVGLIRQQTITELANTSDSLPLNLGFNATADVEGLVKSKKDIDVLQASLVTSQIATADAEKALTGQKIVTELAQTGDSLEDVPSIYGYNHETVVAGLIKLQKDKVTQEGLLVTSQIAASDLEGHLVGQKIVTELAQTGDDLTDVKLADFGYNTESAVSGLIKSQKDKVLKEADLVDSQIQSTETEKALIGQKIITELSQTCDTLADALSDYGFNDTFNISGIVKAQKDKILSEGLLVDTQTESMTSEIDLTGQKIISELANTSTDISKAVLKYGFNNELNIVSGLIATQATKVLKEGQLIDRQILSADAETDLTGQKIITELANTGNSLVLAKTKYGLNNDASNIVEGLIKSQVSKVLKEGELIDSQKDSALAEKALIGQKLVTELAQTSDTLSGPLADEYGYNTVSTIDGILGLEKDKSAAQIALIDKQMESADAEKDLIGQKIITELANTGDDAGKAILALHGYNMTDTIGGLVASQKAKVIKEGELIDSQKVQSEAEILLTQQKVITELVNTSDTIPVDAGAIGLNTSNALGGLLKVQKDKIIQETDLTEQKVATELAQTHNTIPAGLGKQAAGYDVAGVIVNQLEKSTAETRLLKQKAITELAQTGDSIPVEWGVFDSTALVPVAGYVGKQSSVLAAQEEGFKRDAEQKLAKIMVDAWSVDRTMGDTTASDITHLGNADLGSVVLKAKAGIGA